MDLIFEAPLNSLSFGNVSYNILRELYEKEANVGLFPIGNIQMESYDIPQDFGKWIQSSINNRWKMLAAKAPALKLWHLNGAENKKSPTQVLYTFYECSQPTEVEVAICNSQTKTVFSSQYARDRFVDAGGNNTLAAPLGFDKDFHNTGRKYLDGVIHFGLFGKFENRKRTKEIIRAWVKKYGNDNKYQLTCCITNPFFKTEQMKQALVDSLEGKRYTNVNFLPFLKTNKEVNEVLNAIDIDLTGLSGGEGWNLPSFNATCLGKWSIVSNNTSHKDWATDKNSILVEPDGTFPCADGLFFAPTGEFNQGVFYSWNEEDVIVAMEKAEKLAGTKNEEGIRLGTEMTYSKLVDNLLSIL